MENTVPCFALYQGYTVYSVHPSVDDAISTGARKGFLPKREYPLGCVFNGNENIFGSAGGVAPCIIVPSKIDDFWCLQGAEGDENACLMQAFDYFPHEEWMDA